MLIYFYEDVNSNGGVMKYTVNINGIDVEATYSDDNINNIFVPLLKRLANMYRDKHSRILVMVAAPPGAGKSTLVSFLENLSKKILEDISVQAIGMDGFHRRQEYLTSHNALVDGTEVPMVSIKGAPITFDLDRLKEFVTKALNTKSCGWPSYNRHLHNPVEDAITVSADILLLEGNYLLLEEEGWSDLSQMADYSIFIRADDKMLRNRLIERKAASGNTLEAAEKFVDYSDMRNVRLCLNKSKKADLELEIDDNNEYRIL